MKYLAALRFGRAVAMDIVCVGGGPAGLYFAISMKRRDPAHRVRVVERNRPDDTFGWGVVLSDQTLDNQDEREGCHAGRHQRLLIVFIV